VWKGANGSGGNYASSIKYTPHGALTSMILDGSGLTEATTYNSRLQPVSMQAGSLLTLGYFYCPGGASTCRRTAVNRRGERALGTRPR
jgi:hypothetical protein